MKSATIRKVLRGVLDAWVKSIDDPAVAKLVADHSIITGGAIASMLLKEKVNDYDVYFQNRETVLAVARHYVAKFKPILRNGIVCPIMVHEEEEGGRIKIVIKSAGIASEDGTEKPYQYFESRADGEAAGYVGETMGDSGEIEDRYEETQELAQEATDEGKAKFRPVFMSTNAITLSHRVQVVIRFYGEPDKIHENYDFVHCTNYWKSWDGELVLRPAALEALLSRELRYVGSKYPVCSVIRLRKFIKRGFTINAGQILKMLLQVSKLDLTDPSVLEDQLTGVDAAYFIQLLERVKAKNPDKIDAAYLVEIIDRMF